MPRLAPDWTDEEKERLAIAFAEGGTAAAVVACPGRTPDSCRRMAGILGVRAGQGVRREIARLNRTGRGRMTQGEVLELRGMGASVAEIADMGGLSIERVHKMLEGQPRRIRCRDAGELERAELVA